MQIGFGCVRCCLSHVKHCHSPDDSFAALAVQTPSPLPRCGTGKVTPHHRPPKRPADRHSLLAGQKGVYQRSPRGLVSLSVGRV